MGAFHAEPVKCILPVGWEIKTEIPLLGPGRVCEFTNLAEGRGADLTGEADSKRSGGHNQRAALAVFIWLLPLAAVILAVYRRPPALASLHGAGIDRMLNYLMITVGALFIVGHLILGYFVWRFGKPRHGAYRPVTRKAEQRWSLVPVLVMAAIAEGGVFALGLPVWKQIYASQAPGEALTVEVTAEQFAWNVRYPGADGRFGATRPELISLDNPLGLDGTDPASADDVILLGRLNVPLGRPVGVRLRSKDVIHSFFLPQFRVRQDVVPGMAIDVWFVPTQLGTFEIACGQICGFGHFQMRGVLEVMTPEAFEHWMKELAASP